jgi:hypothetical protein
VLDKRLDGLDGIISHSSVSGPQTARGSHCEVLPLGLRLIELGSLLGMGSPVFWREGIHNLLLRGSGGDALLGVKRFSLAANIPLLSRAALQGANAIRVYNIPGILRDIRDIPHCSDWVTKPAVSFTATQNALRSLLDLVKQSGGTGVVGLWFRGRSERFGVQPPSELIELVNRRPTYGRSLSNAQIMGSLACGSLCLVYGAVGRILSGGIDGVGDSRIVIYYRPRPNSRDVCGSTLIEVRLGDGD